MGMDKKKNIAEYSADYRTVYKRAIPGKGPVRQKGKPAPHPAAAMPENTAKREDTQPEGKLKKQIPVKTVKKRGLSPMGAKAVMGFLWELPCFCLRLRALYLLPWRQV